MALRRHGKRPAEVGKADRTQTMREYTRDLKRRNALIEMNVKITEKLDYVEPEPNGDWYIVDPIVDLDTV